MYKNLCMLVSALAVVNAHVTQLGPCPNIPAKQNFMLYGFLGKWYEHQRYPDIFESGGKCITSSYIMKGSTVSAQKKVLNEKSNAEFRYNLELTQSSPNVGKFSAKFIDVPFQPTTTYQIIDTDYSTFALAYSCKDFFFFHKRFVWIFTRTQFPFEFNINSAKAAMIANNLSLDPLIISPHDSCPVIY